MMQHTWVFQLSRALTEAEAAQVQVELDRFLAQWKSHGAPVPGTAEIPYRHFIVVQAVPGTTSGCSIDAMNKGVEGILAKTNISLLGPERVFYRNAQGNIDHVDFRSLSAAILAGHLGADTHVFDSSLGQKGDLAKWEVRLSDTWMQRFLPQKA
jgi:hypothetical protein